MQTHAFDQHQSSKFLSMIRQKLSHYRIDLVWDNAPWHKGEMVPKALLKNRIHEHRLPGYSPEMNAAEYFIRWAKEKLSYNFCWKDLDTLKNSFQAFVATLAYKKADVLQRCKPKMLGFNTV